MKVADDHDARKLADDRFDIAGQSTRKLRSE